MIEVYDLKLHLDVRGWLFESGVEHPAYWYATSCFPGIVKGWHRHRAHTDRLCCVSGLARIVAIGEDGGVREVVCGPMQPKLVVIPPGAWHGFAAVGAEPCVVVNSPDLPYDPDDEERLAWDMLPFDWGRVNG